MCYHMRRFPVGYQSGQLGRTVNPLALPSYVRIVDPPPFFRPTTIFRPWLRPRAFLFYRSASPRKHEGAQGTGHEGRRYRRPGEQRTERAGPKGQTFHGHGEQSARQARDGWSGGHNANRPISTKTQKAEQEMQEIQEIQERPCGATDKAAGPSFAYWHVADVPGVQGQLEVWKLGCLDAWKFGFSAQRLFCRARAARSVFCFLFSVLWGALAPLPLPGRGAVPHTLPIS